MCTANKISKRLMANGLALSIGNVGSEHHCERTSGKAGDDGLCRGMRLMLGFSAAEPET